MSRKPERREDPGGASRRCDTLRGCDELEFGSPSGETRGSRPASGRRSRIASSSVFASSAGGPYSRPRDRAWFDANPRPMSSNLIKMARAARQTPIFVPRGAESCGPEAEDCRQQLTTSSRGREFARSERAPEAPRNRTQLRPYRPSSQRGRHRGRARTSSIRPSSSRSLKVKSEPGPWFARSRYSGHASISAATMKRTAAGGGTSWTTIRPCLVMVSPRRTVRRAGGADGISPRVGADGLHPTLLVRTGPGPP